MGDFTFALEHDKRDIILFDFNEGVSVAVHPYVLVLTEVGKAESVARAMRELDGVVTAHDVTGPYDVIVQVEAESIDRMGQMVVQKMQMIEGITRTLTCPIVDLASR